MKLNREGVALNAEERNKRNQNWTTLETEVTTVSDAVKEALPIAEEALGLSGNLQAQINTLVVEGDSSVEAKQARVDAKGVEAPTLKARLDAEQQATTQQLADKVGGTIKATMNDLGQDVKEALTGGSVAVVGTGAVGSINIQPKAVTASKTDFINKLEGVNLFNKNAADLVVGKYIGDLNGTISSNASYVLTGFIEVDPNTTYRTNMTGVINRSAFYDANKQFIATGTLYEPTTTANTKYVRLHMLITQTDSFMFYKYEGIVLPYTPYKEAYTIKSEIKISDSNIENKSLSPEKMSFIEKKPGINLFNKNSLNIVSGKYISQIGVLSTSETYGVSDFIEIEPETNYRTNASAGTLNVSVFYDANKTIIGSGGIYEIVSPAQAKYIKINFQLKDIETLIFYKFSGEVYAYVPYEESYVFSSEIRVDKKTLTTDERLKQSTRLYSLHDCLNRWEKGEKFPIAFMGDSTTDGVGTSTHPDATYNNVIGTDHKSLKAYPLLLENKLREFTGNSTLRVYNAGFSGMTTDFAMKNMDSVFLQNPYYKDVKMIGIMYGINDRTMDPEKLKQNLKGIAIWCLDNGIQPFFLTPQTIVQGSSDLTSIQTSFQLSTVVAQVIKEFATAYNLELVDVNKITSHFMDYSKVAVNDILGDTLHFSDAGHRFEADYLFSLLIGSTLYVDGKKNVAITNPLVKRGYNRTQSRNDSTTFKRFVEYTATTVDSFINEAHIFNLYEGQLELKVDVSATSNFYFKVNGVNHVPSDLVKLDVGLHKIEIFSGIGTTGKYYGFSLGTT